MKLASCSFGRFNAQVEVNSFHSLAVLFSSVSFFGYGFSCIVTQRMKGEFLRYGLSRFRVLTGLLQIAAAIGLALSFWKPVLGLIAASGLTVQMLLGFGVRLKIRDGLIRSSPAFFYMVLNAYLVPIYL